MKLLFINQAYPVEHYDQMYADAKGVLQVSNNGLQWNVIEGLEQNGVDYTLASLPALPAWPRYRHFLTPLGTMIVNGVERGRYLRYCDAPFIKLTSQRRVLRSFIRHWCCDNLNEDKLYIIVYSQLSQYLGAAIDLKDEFPQLTIATIITDLVENAFDFESNRSVFKRLILEWEAKEEHKMFPKVDKYILLTKQMEECIPEAIGRSIVVEGIAFCKNAYVCKTLNDEQERVLLYTGVLEEYAGVEQMVDAFMMTEDDRFRLVICGFGPSGDYIRKSADRDSRIVFKGRVNHNEVIQLQRKATVLINPRRPNGNITKYSFPSKTMEYMVSGTPMIGYKLEGMPEEYFSHMFIPDGLSTDDLASCINSTLSLPDGKLKAKAESARIFVTEKKNPTVQVKKILDFLKE